MIKSESDIERDFYKYVSSSRLGKEIKGSVYRDGMRPDNSSNEDAIVAFLAGVDGQTQTGEVIVNVYVPDKAYKGKLVKAYDRIAKLEGMIPDLVQNCKGVDYFVETSTTSKVHAVEDIHQHCLSIRLQFKCLTD